jgi:hypothetical protein
VTRRPCLLAAAVCAIGLAAAQQTQAATRACTAAERENVEQGGHLPFRLTPAETPLRSDTAYGLELDTSGTVPGSAVVMADRGTVTSNGGAFTLTTGAAGALTLTLSYELALIDDKTGEPAGTCSATSTAHLVVREPTLVRLRRARSATAFTVAVSHGAAPVSLLPVTYEVRLRQGSAVAPSLHSAPVQRLVYDYPLLAPKGLRPVSKRIGRVLSFVRSDQGTGLISVGPRYLYDRRGSVRFGVSIRVLQGDRVVGGARAGVTCRYRPLPRDNTVCSYSRYQAVA